MKKNNNIRLLFLSIMLVSVSSCKKMLDLQPLDQISDVTYWKSPNDFKLVANSFYLYERKFQDVLLDGIHSDLRSDLLTNNTSLPFSNGTNSISPSDANYNLNYSHIYEINYFLEKAETYKKPDEIKQYVAEAKFFRAYVYFELLQAYGDVPLIKKPLTKNDFLLMGSRNSRDEISDFIIEDLKAAIIDLPQENKIVTDDKGRVSKGAAQGFLSRVALYEGTWQKFRTNISRGNVLLDIAITSSNDVIVNGQYGLFGTTAATSILGDSALKYMFILENQKSNPAGITKSANKEYILANRYDEAMRISNLNITKITFASNVVMLPTRTLANMYLCSDGLPIEKSTLFKGYSTITSEFENRDNRMQYTLMISGRNYWNNVTSRVNWTGDVVDIANAAYKPLLSNFGTGYQNQKWATERNVAFNYESYDYPVIRFAEVLLNYAEAVYERNNAISDDDLNLSLNKVRTRINISMPPLTNAFVATNALNMQTEIRRERTVEMYNEGFRVDDLKRWKTAEIEMPKPAVGIKWTGTQFETIWPGASTIPKNANGVLILEGNRIWDQKNYLLPLPEDQIKVNPNLTQNPGW